MSRTAPRALSEVVYASVRKLVFISVSACQVTVDPALCVALGAAMYGGALEGALAGGFELADGAYSWILHDRVSGLHAQ